MAERYAPCIFGPVAWWRARLAWPGPEVQVAETRRRQKRPDGSQSRAGPRPLEERTIQQLRRRAYQLGIQGFSRMRKDVLIAAIRERRRRGHG